MADQEEIKEPNLIYKKDEWARKPWSSDHENTEYIPDWYWAQDGEDLKKIARECDVTAKYLSRFNWGTPENNWEKQANYYLKNYCKCVLLGKTYVFYGKPCFSGLWIPVEKGQGLSRSPTLLARRSPTAVKKNSCRDPNSSQCQVDKSVSCISHDKAEGKTVNVDIGERWPGIRDKVIGEFLEAQSWMMYLRKRSGTWFNGLRWTEETLMLDVQAGLTAEQKEKRIENLKRLPPVSVKTATISWDAKEKKTVPKPWELEAVAEHLRVLREARVIKRLVVRGYACAAGSFEHNMKLSKARAEWVIDKLKTRFGLLFKPLIPEVLLGCGETFSRQPIPWDRVAVIEVELKEPEKSEEAKDIEEIFRKADESAQKSGEGKEVKLISLCVQGIYCWTYTDMSYGTMTAKKGRRTTLKYANEQKSALGINPTDFDKIKKQASKFVDLFYDFLLEADPEACDKNSKTIGMLRAWVNGLQYIQEGQPKPPEKLELTPFDPSLTRTVPDPLVPLGYRTIGPFYELDPKEKGKGTWFDHNADPALKHHMNETQETEFSAVSLDINKQGTTRARELAEDFTHDLPPLIIHFNFDMP
ncbi:MAG: hypothetical protein WAV28_17215 [Sedimentisphaerales bacterium]